MSIEFKEVGTRDLWQQFERKPLDVYVAAANRMKDAGVEDAPSMTRALEEISPTDPTDKSGLDAFDRLMMEAGIRTSSNPQAGYYASTADKFLTSAGTRALLTEFANRQWRKVSYGEVDRNEVRASLLSTDGIIGGWERPYYDTLKIRPSVQIQPAIPLSELVGMTTAITGDAYRAYYLTYDATMLRRYRVGETAEIPIATIVGAERTVRLKKYGRGVSTSYEAMRRIRVDKMAYFIQWMAVQAEIDKVAACIDILVNGDGNTGTAATSVAMTTLDPGSTAGTLRVSGWEAFLLSFDQPYMMTTALMQKAVALQVRMLNTGTANIPLVVAQLPLPNLSLINTLGDGVRYGYTVDAPALKILGFDKRFALERVTEIGSEISETERYVTSQTQTLVISEVEGYMVPDRNASKLLDINA